MRSHLERFAHDGVEALVGAQAGGVADLRKGRHQQQPLHAALGQLSRLDHGQPTQQRLSIALSCAAHGGQEGTVQYGVPSTCHWRRGAVLVAGRRASPKESSRQHVSQGGGFHSRL